jgi:hypothetical protein
MYLYEMTPSQIDAMAERHFDRMLDRYLAEQEAPDAWEIIQPDWHDIADMVDGMGWVRIIDIVRSYVEMDTDIMEDAYKAGLLDPYIAPEDEWKRKDPDDEWKLIDSTFEAQWQNDDLFRAIYLWMPDQYVQRMAQRLIDNADENGIRDEYNDDHRDSFRGREDD